MCRWYVHAVMDGHAEYAARGAPPHRTPGARRGLPLGRARVGRRPLAKTAAIYARVTLSGSPWKGLAMVAVIGCLLFSLASVVLVFCLP